MFLLLLDFLYINFVNKCENMLYLYFKSVILNLHIVSVIIYSLFHSPLTICVNVITEGRDGGINKLFKNVF